MIVKNQIWTTEFRHSFGEHSLQCDICVLLFLIHINY